MSEQIAKQQDVLAKLIERHTKEDGVHETTIPSLFFIRHSYATGPTYGVYEPSFCIVVQGAKEVWLGHERFQYSPTDYLIASVNLPVTAQVTEASADLPYLGFKLKFTPEQILEVLSDSKVHIEPHKTSKRGMYVSQMEPSLLDAVLRLVRLIDTPEDIPFLSPIFTKEILYRILQGQHGFTLEQIAIEGSSAYRIKNAIEHIVNHFDRSVRIEELAHMVNMSVASLHRHFKEVTTMSPIQFQKQLRLQEARRLLLSKSTDATDVAFRVGYESPSQFSREYSRMFGLPPREDVMTLREHNDKAIEACPNDYRFTGG